MPSRGLPKMGKMASQWERSKILCSFPVAVLVTIAALDSADKALLGASFPMLEKTLGLHVDTLGYFSLFTNLSYALCLPFWGWLVHRYTVKHAHTILSASCLLWGVATLSIAHSNTVVAQAFFRTMNGASLASILPLSQMMLVDLVPVSLRGSAFGLQGLLEKAAATIATSAVVYYADWRIPYLAVGSISVLMAFVAKQHLQMKVKLKGDENGESSGGHDLSLLDIFRRISRIPSFVYLVMQGLFGAVPWDMMSFHLLLLEWRGYSKQQIISFQFVGGILHTFGALLGGVLGDYFAHLPNGRTGVAIASVLLGIGSYALFLFSETYQYSIVWNCVFYLTAGWCPAAACRPMCADLAQNQSERAQIIAAWVLLEKTSSAVFGAPLVGVLTKRLFDENSISTNNEKARVLARNLFLLSTFFWVMCAYFFWCMGRAEHDRKKQLHKEKANDRNYHDASHHA